LYETSRKIEERISKTLRLIKGNASRTELAKKLNVSMPTVSRLVAELRLRGNNIRSVRDSSGNWHYELTDANNGRKRKRKASQMARS